MLRISLIDSVIYSLYNMKTNLLIAVFAILSIGAFASDKEKDSLSISKNSPSIFAELSAYSGIIKDVATSHKCNANQGASA